MIEWFLALPIGVRLTLFLAIMLVIWWIFGRLVLKLLSLIPMLLKHITIIVYFLIELPISFCHKLAGGMFAAIDQGIANLFDNISTGFHKLYLLASKPKAYRRTAFYIFLVLAIYLTVPHYAGLNEKIFSFWQEEYLRSEQQVVVYINEKGWFE